MASGSGEQVAQLLAAARKQRIRLPAFTLSDLYPSPAAWAILQHQYGQDAVHYSGDPLSALDVPRSLPRRWSIFSAFHHFAPDEARKLLGECVAEGDGLCITEFTKRRWLDLPAMILALPVHLLVPFFANRFAWRKLLFTTVIPIVPFMVSFDGIVSVLRTYSKDEIIAMLPPGWDNDFVAEYREVRWRVCPLKATMFSLRRKSA